ncbi:MAG: proteasome assembly chaperone family protein [Candidatus Aenigmatarchaeota archaeon]
MTTLNIFEQPKLQNPLLVEGLPGIGNVGRICVDYIIQETGAKLFAELYSEHFFPFVVIHEKWEIRLLKVKFYYLKGKRDVVFVTGDCQSMTSQGHYEVMEKIVDLAQKIGVKEIITVGGLATGEIEEKPRVYGAATDKSIVEKYKEFGINFNTSEKVGYIVGAAGILLGLGKQRGIDGLCLLGETSGFPIVADPRAAEAVLNILSKILEIKIDMSKLDKRVKEMERLIKKIQELQEKAISQLAKEEERPPVKKEQLRYIG